MFVTVERSYLARVVQTYTVNLPDDLDVTAWADADPVAFDEHVCDFGHLDDDHDQQVDDDQLDTRITRIDHDDASTG